MDNRPSTRTAIILLAALLVVSLASCGPSETPTPYGSDLVPTELPASTRVPTQIPSPTTPPTPTPLPPTPEPITFDNVCTHYGEEIQIEGLLHLPDQISCTTGGSPDWCTVHLLDTDREGWMVVGLNILAGVYDPAQNFMADLPMSYEMSDFKVRANDGRLLSEGDLVRLSGRVTSPLLGAPQDQEIVCSLENIYTVERIERITFTGPEPLTSANLLDAILNGWVIASITGDGLSRIDITLKPQVDFNLELEIEPGTVFEAQSGGVQNMVVRRGTVVVLKPNIEISLELEVSCANMELKEPTGSDTFVISQGQAHDDLVKLLNLAEFRFETGSVQQFAIWTITDNPSRNGYTSIVDAYGNGSGPTEDEIERIRALFEEAGIDITQYRVFNP